MCHYESHRTYSKTIASPASEFANSVTLSSFIFAFSASLHVFPSMYGKYWTTCFGAVWILCTASTPMQYSFRA